MVKINDKEACLIHGIISSDSESDADGKREFDEEYNSLKPPPLDLETIKDKLVVISPEKTPSVWEERLNQNQNGDEINKAEISAVILPKKKKKKKAKSLIVTENEDADKRDMEVDEESRELRMENLPLSDEASFPPLIKKPSKRVKMKIDDEVAVSEVNWAQKRWSIENSERKISYNPELLKKMREQLGELDKEKIEQHGLDKYSAYNDGQDLNLIRKKENGVIESLTPNSPRKETKAQKKMKKKLLESTSENGLNDNNTPKDASQQAVKQIAKDDAKQTKEISTGAKKKTAQNGAVKRQFQTDPLPTTTTDNPKKSILQELEYVFGEDFREFLQSMLRGGATVSDLSSFTYEQLSSAYNGYLQKKKMNAWHNAAVRQYPVQANTVAWHPLTNASNNPMFYPDYFNQNYSGNRNFNQTYHPFHQGSMGWNIPSQPNVNFVNPQQNINWYQFGNPNPNLTFSVYIPPNPSSGNLSNSPRYDASTSSNTLTLTEIKEDVEKNQQQNVAALMTDPKTQTENKEMLTETVTKQDGPLEKKISEKSNKRECTSKLPLVEETGYASSTSSCSVNGNAVPSKKKRAKKKQKKVVDGSLDGSSVQNVKQENCEVKNVEQNKAKQPTVNSSVQGVKNEKCEVKGVTQNTGSLLGNVQNVKEEKCEVKNTQQKKTKQSTDGSLNGSSVQNVKKEECEVKNVQVAEALLYTKYFDASLNDFIEKFKEGIAIVVECQKIEQLMDKPHFLGCTDLITEFLQIIDHTRIALQKCISLCSFIQSNTHNNTAINNRQYFTTYFQHCQQILNVSIPNFETCEKKLIHIYKPHYNRFVKSIILARAATGQCKITCDFINEEIIKSGWHDEKLKIPTTVDENKKIAVCLENSSGKKETITKNAVSTSNQPLQANHSNNAERLLSSLNKSNKNLKSCGVQTMEGIKPDTVPNETIPVVITTDNSDEINDEHRNILTRMSNFYKDDFEQLAERFLRGINSDSWWCYVTVFTLVAYLVVEALRCVLSFFSDNIFQIWAALLICIYLSNKK